MNQKVLIIGDLHFGIMNSSNFLMNQIKFFDETAIPYCKENKIKKIIFEGDIFDVRKGVDTLTQNIALDLFQNKLKDFEIIMYLGNHDIPLKSSTEYSSLKIFGLLPNVTLIETITEMKIFNKDVLIVPWQTDIKNFEDYVKEINPKKYDLVLGHFDVINSRMNRSKLSEIGFNKDVFSRFKLVFSGHYHSYSEERNGNNVFVYTGVPYQLNRGDFEEPKYFFCLDFSDMSYEKIENNKSTKFVKMIYPESPIKNKIKNNIVDVYCSNNISNEDLQDYLKSIEDLKPFANPIVKFLECDEILISSEEIRIQSLDLMFSDYIKNLNIETETKFKVETEINDLFELCKRDEIN